MAFVDHWEIDSTDESAIWERMIGKPHEDYMETTQQVDVILNGIHAGERALEIGAGVGRLLRSVYVRELFREVVGVDSSLSMVMASGRYLRDYPNVKVPEIILNDGFTLAFPDNHFDFVYSFTCFQHMITLAMIHRNLVEIHRVLIPGGLCRIQTICSGDLDPRDTKQFDGRVFHDEIDFADRFCEAGLEPIDGQRGLTHHDHVWVTARKAI